ncbi:MAG: M20 family metallopeptidase [Acidobacteriaceae bacterium]
MIADKELAIVNELRASVAGYERWMTKILTDLVRIESPSHQPEAVNQAVDRVAAEIDKLGGRVRRHRVQGYGDLLEARLGRRSKGTRTVMLLGHLDTVWPIGTLRTMPFRVEAGRAYGPGVFDMKAGVVMALAALRALQESAALDFSALDFSGSEVVLLLNSDEEVGSHASRPLTEKLALEARAVFVLEPAQGEQGAYKTARKGVGQFRLQVTGRAAHSGVDFTAGHSAVLELGRQLERIASLTDLERGITVNPGVIGGGTQANVIAATAWAEIDLRVKTKGDETRIERQLRALRPVDKECRLEWSGELNRPPMERTPETVRLFRQAQALAERMGMPLQEAATGGGSDGNFTSALGVPTLDGMGAVGNGAHAEDESIQLDSLVPRAALLAGMIAKTIKEKAETRSPVATSTRKRASHVDGD